MTLSLSEIWHCPLDEHNCVDKYNEICNFILLHILIKLHMKSHQGDSNMNTTCVNLPATPNLVELAVDTCASNIILGIQANRGAICVWEH